MPSPEALAVIAELRAAPRKADMPDPPSERPEWEARALDDPPPEDVEITPETRAGTACERVKAPGSVEDGLILLLHGGAYIAGTPVTHRKLAYYLSRASRLPVLVPDYRLAPEHPAPAATEDALAVTADLTASGVEPARLLLAGDSAGGGLALSLLLAMRDAGLPLPAAAFLMSPWTDLAARGASYTANRAADPSMNGVRLRNAGRLYAGHRDPLEPLLSPIEADLSGLPPLLIHVGGAEIMLDDATELEERVTAAGGTAQCRVFPDLWHVFHHYTPDVPEAREALAEAGAFLRGALS